jgi:hypothetical protein
MNPNISIHFPQKSSSFVGKYTSTMVRSGIRSALPKVCEVDRPKNCHWTMELGDANFCRQSIGVI